MSTAKPMLKLHLQRRRLGKDPGGRTRWYVEEDLREIPAHRTGIIICDMWDRHWSRGACERVEAMAPRMDTVIDSARSRGVHIIHAPSDVVDFYRDHPARERIARLAPVEMPEPQPREDPPLPVDASDGGSDTGETPWHPAWSRQHPALTIDAARDVISDSGPEIYGYMQHAGIEQLLIMGVHTNMCILNRSFAIKAMVGRGIPIALVRDLTDAMYNPARSPYVSHREGTRLVVEYIESFWCPSISSLDL